MNQSKKNSDICQYLPVYAIAKKNLCLEYIGETYIWTLSAKLDTSNVQFFLVL